jgi:hypothetical protein
MMRHLCFELMGKTFANGEDRPRSGDGKIGDIG